MEAYWNTRQGQSWSLFGQRYITNERSKTGDGITSRKAAIGRAVIGLSVVAIIVILAIGYYSMTRPRRTGNARKHKFIDRDDTAVHDFHQYISINDYPVQHSTIISIDQSIDSSIDHSVHMLCGRRRHRNSWSVGRSLRMRAGGFNIQRNPLRFAQSKGRGQRMHPSDP